MVWEPNEYSFLSASAQLHRRAIMLGGIKEAGMKGVRGDVHTCLRSSASSEVFPGLFKF